MRRKSVTRILIALLSLSVLLLLANCAPPSSEVKSATSTPTETVAVVVEAAEETATPTAEPATATATTEPTETPTALPTKTPTSIPTDRPSPTPRPTRKPTSTPRPARPTPRPTPTPAKVELLLSEDELNEMIQKGMAGRSDLPVSDVHVRLIPDFLVLTAQARIGFFALNMEMVIAVSVADGQAVPEIVDIKANGQPLTGFLRAQVDAMIAPYLDQWLQMDTGVYVEQVILSEGMIRVVGRYE